MKAPTVHEINPKDNADALSHLLRSSMRKTSQFASSATTFASRAWSIATSKNAEPNRSFEDSTGCRA
jgi:hypothetical protein